MAANCNGSRGEQAMNHVREITSGLEHELKLRSEICAVGCASPLRRTMSEERPTATLLLLQKAVQDSRTKTSPRNANSSTGCRGLNFLSPSPSASSDSSMSGGVPTHMGATCKNIEIPSRTRCFSNFISAGPSRQVTALGIPVTPIAAGRGSGNLTGGARNSQMCTSAVGRGRSPVTSPQTIGNAPVKEKKKRKRPSKKPPTQIIKASPDQFRATVQELTGMKSPVATPVDDPLPTVEVVRPQPVRTNFAVPINIGNDLQNLPARPEAKSEARPEGTSESSSPALGSSVRCASPIAPRAHVDIDSYRDNSSRSSSGTSSGKSSMNYVMGFDQDEFPFMEAQKQAHHNPPAYSGLPEEEFDYEDPTPYEVRTRAAVSTRSSFQGPEGNRKEDISNGLERPCGSNGGFGSGSAMPDHSRPSPSERLERGNRPPNDEYFETMEEWDIWTTDSSWIETYT